MVSVPRTLQLPYEGGTPLEIRRHVESVLADVRISRERKDLLRQCLQEMWGSFAEYSQFTGRRPELSLSLEVDPARFRAVFTEPPTEAANPHLDQVVREQPYRMGLTTARRIMNEISYTFRKGDRSEVELVHTL